MPLTMSPVTSSGARLPGTAAVVMTTSDSRRARRSARAACAGTPRLLLRVAALAFLRLEGKLDEGCAQGLHLLLHGRSDVVGGDNGPSRRAVAMACKPATPAPITSTRVGATVPAAVIIIGKSLPIRSAAMRTAL